MSDPKRETARVQFLLTVLGLLLIFSLILLLALAVYPYVFAPADALATAQARNIRSTRSTTPSPSPSLTPSPTRTLRDTFTPTISLTPTRTSPPTLTPTLPGPPTLAPGTPVRGEANYRLQDWTPERADDMIARLEDYPNLLPRQSRGANDENYYAAFQFAIVAYREALLRFPDAPQVDEWQWKLAYNLALLGDPQAGEHYAGLIEQSLNRDQVKLEGLQNWLQTQEPRLRFTIIEISPIPGYLRSFLIETRAEGSAFILLHESLSAYQVVALNSDFDFVKHPAYSALIGDLTGDNLDEVVLIKQPAPGDYRLHAPQVFDLSKDQPFELNFNPLSIGFDIGTDFQSQWEIVEDSQGNRGLYFTSLLFPTCPVSISLSYTWDGAWFDAPNPEFKVEPAKGTLSFCRYVVDHASNVWGPTATITLMESLLPLWPPQVDENSAPFPADEIDHWRYQLGINHALAGNRDQALDYLEQVISQPVTPNSSWIAPAKQFQAIYRLENGLYRACVASTDCQPADAMQSLVAGVSPGEYPGIITHLWQQGVSQSSSGYFDFDGDGSVESWVTVRHHPGERLELWILIPYRDGVKAFNLGSIDSTLPHLSYYDDRALPPVILLPDVQAFQVNRLPFNLEPYLKTVELPKFYPDRFKEGLETQVEALFAGESQSNVVKALLSLQENPGLICRGTWSCDRYYYLLGLSAELAKDKSTAIASYLSLWWDYSRSPYTIMARLKLVGTFIVPTATPTLTPVGTNTPTLAPTPTVSGTPPTSTMTSTVTPTTTTYPGPTAMPTPTSQTQYP